MSEAYTSNQGEIKRLNSKLLGKEEEIIRLKQSVESKTEQVKRLSEQYNSSQKPSIYGAANENTVKELNEKVVEIQKLKDKLAAYLQLESQYNSDK